MDNAISERPTLHNENRSLAMEGLEGSFLTHLILAATAWLFLVFLFVQVVDPYGISPIKLQASGLNTIKTERLDIDRLIKPIEVWQQEPKTIFMGTSRIQQSINPLYLQNTGHWPAYNASIPGGELDENLRFLELYLEIAPSITDVYMEAFFYNFARSQELDSQRKGVLEHILDRTSLYLRLSAVLDSINTLRKNIQLKQN